MRLVKRLIPAVLALVLGGFVFIHFSPDYDMYVVRSESMKPAINMGDIIISGPLNREIRPDTIVTFKQNKALVTHRVIAIDSNILTTKGDAMEDTDPHPVTISQVAGIYLFKIPYIGYLSNFMQTRIGWFSVVIIPAT